MPPERETVEFVAGGLLTVAVIVPVPHVPVTAFDCSLRFAGIVSLNATPLRAIVFGLFTVKLNVLVWPTTIVDGVTDFVTVGGDATVRFAVAVWPVPPLVLDTVPVVFVFAPDVVPVTLTLTVHVPPAAIVPPENVRLVFPAAGANVGAPHPDVLAAGVAATCVPAGNGSLKATPVSGSGLPAGFVSVNVSVDVPFKGIVVGL